MSESLILTINGRNYVVKDLSIGALAQLDKVKMADSELTRLQQQLAIVQTARRAYVCSFEAEVDGTQLPYRQKNVRYPTSG